MGTFCSKLCQTEEDYVYVPYYDNGQVAAGNEGGNEGAMAYQSGGGRMPQVPPATHLQPNMQPMFGNSQGGMMPQQMQVVQQAVPAPQQQQGIPVKPIKPVPIMGIPVPRPIQAAVTPGQQQQNPEPHQPVDTAAGGGGGGVGGGRVSYGSSMSSSYPTSYQPACMECLGGGSRGSSY